MYQSGNARLCCSNKQLQNLNELKIMSHILCRSARGLFLEIQAYWTISISNGGDHQCQEESELWRVSHCQWNVPSVGDMVHEQPLAWTNHLETPNHGGGQEVQSQHVPRLGRKENILWIMLKSTIHCKRRRCLGSSIQTSPGQWWQRWLEGNTSSPSQYL